IYFIQSIYRMELFIKKISETMLSYSSDELITKFDEYINLIRTKQFNLFNYTKINSKNKISNIINNQFKELDIQDDEKNLENTINYIIKNESNNNAYTKWIEFCEFQLLKIY